MDDRELARLLAYARMGLAAALLAAPRLVGGIWIGRAADHAGARAALRGLAARDVALGLGLKTALDRRRPARGWLEAGAFADAADVLATLAAGRDLPAAGRLLVLAMASTGTALGVRLARSLG